jgi:Ferritin-like
MKNPATWGKADLFRHLQHALDLELWTIPLYLTALYSIRDLTKMKHEEYPEAARLIFSVVVQEMLHVELVCNLSNALGHAPQFRYPEYSASKGIPFIHPLYESVPEIIRGYEVKPQALSRECLQLFCAIEMPQPVKDFVWEDEAEYNSIAEVYEAIKLGVATLWDSCYVGDEANTKQKNSFEEYHKGHGKKHGFSIMIRSAASALKAIEAIIEQGEGADDRHVPLDFRPPDIDDGEEMDAAWYKGELSHYQKFTILLHTHRRLPPIYQEDLTGASGMAQKKMEKNFKAFWQLMEIHFNRDGEDMPDEFWKKMISLGKSIAAVWQSGRCPDFAFRE